MEKEGEAVAEEGEAESCCPRRRTRRCRQCRRYRPSRRSRSRRRRRCWRRRCRLESDWARESFRCRRPGRSCCRPGRSCCRPSRRSCQGRGRGRGSCPSSAESRKPARASSPSLCRPSRGSPSLMQASGAPAAGGSGPPLSPWGAPLHSRAPAPARPQRGKRQEPGSKRWPPRPSAGQYHRRNCPSRRRRPLSRRPRSETRGCRRPRPSPARGRAARP